jgi:hypothetical protein
MLLKCCIGHEQKSDQRRPHHGEIEKYRHRHGRLGTSACLRCHTVCGSDVGHARLSRRLRYATACDTAQPIIRDWTDNRLATVRQFQIHGRRERDSNFTRLSRDVQLKCRGRRPVALLRAVYNLSGAISPNARGRNRYFHSRDERERDESRGHGPN